MDESLSKLLDRLRQAPRTSDEVHRHQLRDAERERRYALAILQHDLGARYAPRRVADLATFEIYDHRQTAAVDAIKRYAAHLGKHVAAGDGLVLYGAIGTGKDHLLAWLLYQAARKHGLTCRWLNGQEFYGQIRDRISRDESEAELMSRLCAPDVLAISDPSPPAGDASNWNLSQLYRALDRRYRALRPTWVTLNASTVEEADERLSAPVFDRLRDGAVLIPCFWESKREPAK